MHRIFRIRASRPASSSANANTVTDITTSLIGVMLLVLLGILVTTATGTSLVELVESRQDPRLRAASPASSTRPNAVCLEVSREGVRLLRPGIPGDWSRDWRKPESPVMTHLRAIAAVQGREYPLLLVRPGGAQQARELRGFIRDMGLNVGVELLSSQTQVIVER
jgi:hypothetical protein